MSLSTNVVICAMARTPIGKFCGSLSSFKGSELGSMAVRGALNRITSGREVDWTVREAFLGNVVSAGMGQAPCRQAVLGAGLPESTICTTINKVCASGMKSVMLATQSLQAAGTATPGYAMLAGGFESMSNIPHYLPHSRTGTSLGHTQLLDGVIHDGLWDVYNNQHMGMCAEKCATDYAISRQEQDAYTLESYRRAVETINAGLFQQEIVPVTVPPKRKGAESTMVQHDEEPKLVDAAKLATLKPAFDRTGNGTVTAANSSSLNDGAAALILMTEQDAIDRQIQPLARIRGYGDAARNPVDFTTAPSLAVPVALQHAKLQLSDVEYHEINEAFAVVAIANQKLMNLHSDRVNVFGGAVALGHPIGMSGARIIMTLYSVLKHKDATIGCASICNGGGGASAIVLERLH